MVVRSIVFIVAALLPVNAFAQRHYYVVPEIQLGTGKVLSTSTSHEFGGEFDDSPKWDRKYTPRRLALGLGMVQDSRRLELAIGFETGYPGTHKHAALWGGGDLPALGGANDALQLVPSMLLGIGTGAMGTPIDWEDGIDRTGPFFGAQARVELRVSHFLLRLGAVYRFMFATSQSVSDWGMKDESFKSPGLSHDISGLLAVGGMF